MSGKYKERDIVEQHVLFLDYSVGFIHAFYFDNVCPLLNQPVFCVCITILR